MDRGRYINMRHLNIFAPGLFVICGIISCSPALPVEPRQEELGASYIAAREAAQEAKQAADRCHAEAQKSRAYLEEARAALRKVEDMQRREEEARRKAAEVKKKRIVIRRPKKPAPVETPILQPSTVPDAPEKAPLTEAPKFPEHSPSDHP